MSSRTNISPPNGILTELFNALNNAVGLIPGGKASPSELESANVLLPGATSFINNQSNNSNNNAPRAFLNWILFDEQFNLVSSSSGFEQVPEESYFDNGNPPFNITKLHVFNNMPVNKNGYLYIYVSNETPDIDVFFNDLQVTHLRGAILETNNFYQYGLIQSGISSRAAGVLENKEKTFQGQRFDDDLGVDVYSFKYRNEDRQTGRFWQIDPLADKYVHNSTYAFSENKVTTHVELEGLEAVSVGTPQGYLQEGFRQIFQAVGNIFSFNAEVHANKEVEVKTEIKTPAGTVENKTTTTVVENKAEFKSKLGDYFKNGGGDIFEFSVGSNKMSKVENTTSATISANGVPIKMSSKTTVDQNGTSQTTSLGTGASVNIGDKGKVNVFAGGFVTQQQTGSNAGQTTLGFKAAVDATFVSKPVPLINTPTLKVSTSTQTTVGGSFTQTYKFPWQ